MTTHRLDELECDEIYHALLERKTTLEKRIKDLEEKDGLPEAAEAVRERLSIYNPNGEGTQARPGLIRQFAPQRDLEAEARNHEPERAADGGQDHFGGGVETGGSTKKAAAAKTPAKPAAKTGAKKGAKKAGAKKGGRGTPDGATLPLANAGEPVDAEYEIIEEGRRLGAGDAPSGPTTANLSTEQTDALDRLEAIAGGLVAGKETIDPEEFDKESARVLELVTAAGSAFGHDAVERAGQVFAGEYRDAAENARNLGQFVLGMLAPHRSAPENERPVGAGAKRDMSPDERRIALEPEPDVAAASTLSFAPPASADAQPGDAQMNDVPDGPAGGVVDDPHADGYTAEGARAEAAHGGAL